MSLLAAAVGAPHDTSMAKPAGLCYPLPPLAAYAADFPERERGQSDEDILAWLHAGSIIWRIGQMDEADRASAFASGAVWLASGTATSGAGGDHGAAQHALTTEPLRGVFARADGRNTSWSADFARAVQDGAQLLEQRGAFRLAYSLLAGSRAVGSLSATDSGRMVLLQGRLARQFGAMESAEDHYLFAEQVGRRVREPDLRIRATLGRGVVAAMRGNYPEARTHFRRGLRAATRWGLTEHVAAGHNALLMAAVSAQDLDGALTHGWYAFTYSAMLPDRQAEILINLGEVALLAGHPHATLAACETALTLTTIDRVQLSGFGTGARAASRLGQRETLDGMASQTLAVIQGSRQEFDKACTLLELAEAYAGLGAVDEAAQYVERSMCIAEPRGYFELLHRAEQLARRLAGNKPRGDDPGIAGSHRADPGTHEPTAAATDVVLSRSSRRVIESLAELRS